MRRLRSIVFKLFVIAAFNLAFLSPNSYSTEAGVSSAAISHISVFVRERISDIEVQKFAASSHLRFGANFDGYVELRTIGELDHLSENRNQRVTFSAMQNTKLRLNNSSLAMIYPN